MLSLKKAVSGKAVVLFGLEQKQSGWSKSRRELNLEFDLVGLGVLLLLRERLLDLAQIQQLLRKPARQASKEGREEGRKEERKEGQRMRRRRSEPDSAQPTVV
eukprot:263896-Rhodomonas_salina.5